jgi:uncharacterized protein with PIN domain
MARDSTVPHTRRIIVHNLSQQDIDETINGRRYRIAGLRSIEMSRREAIELRGFMPQLMENGNKKDWMFEFEEVPSSGSSLKENTKKCPVCGEDFLDSQEDLFRQHLVKHADRRIKSEEDEKKSEPVTTRVYVCPKCDREFDNGHGAKIHTASCKGKVAEPAAVAA